MVFGRVLLYVRKNSIISKQKKKKKIVKMNVVETNNVYGPASEPKYMQSGVNIAVIIEYTRTLLFLFIFTADKSSYAAMGQIILKTSVRTIGGKMNNTQKNIGISTAAVIIRVFMLYSAVSSVSLLICNDRFIKLMFIEIRP